jgi:hypothetical protein
VVDGDLLLIVGTSVLDQAEREARARIERWTGWRFTPEREGVDPVGTRQKLAGFPLQKLLCRDSSAGGSRS